MEGQHAYFWECLHVAGSLLKYHLNIHLNIIDTEMEAKPNKKLAQNIGMQMSAELKCVN